MGSRKQHMGRELKAPQYLPDLGPKLIRHVPYWAPCSLPPKKNHSRLTGTPFQLQSWGRSQIFKFLVNEWGKASGSWWILPGRSGISVTYSGSPFISGVAGFCLFLFWHSNLIWNKTQTLPCKLLALFIHMEAGRWFACDNVWEDAAESREEWWHKGDFLKASEMT